MVWQWSVWCFFPRPCSPPPPSGATLVWTRNTVLETDLPAIKVELIQHIGSTNTVSWIRWVTLSIVLLIWSNCQGWRVCPPPPLLSDHGNDASVCHWKGSIVWEAKTCEQAWTSLTRKSRVLPIRKRWKETLAFKLLVWFLSYPGKPGVRSLGPDVRPPLSEWKTLCRLNWCDSGWWGYQLNTN